MKDVYSQPMQLRGNFPVRIWAAFSCFKRYKLLCKLFSFSNYLISILFVLLLKLLILNLLKVMLCM